MMVQHHMVGRTLALVMVAACARPVPPVAGVPRAPAAPLAETTLIISLADDAGYELECRAFRALWVDGEAAPFECFGFDAYATVGLEGGAHRVSIVADGVECFLPAPAGFAVPTEPEGVELRFTRSPCGSFDGEDEGGVVAQAGRNVGATSPQRRF